MFISAFSEGALELQVEQTPAQAEGALLKQKKKKAVTITKHREQHGERYSGTRPGDYAELPNMLAVSH